MGLEPPPSANDSQKYLPENQYSVRGFTFLTVDWWNKPQGEKLTNDEAILQTAVGVSEMFIGAAGGIGSAEATSGTSVIVGLWVMADGGNLMAQSANVVKAYPGSMFMRLANPVIENVMNLPFAIPYP
jgi:hypothetical protein